MHIFFFENNKSIPGCANTINNGPVIVLQCKNYVSFSKTYF